MCSFLFHATVLHMFFCSDTIRLQQQLEELQIRLVTLEKKTADYESMQEELEEKKVCPLSAEAHLKAVSADIYNESVS